MKALWLVMALVLGAPAHADTVAAGAEVWDPDDPVAAISIWESALAEGRPSGVLLYDLGLAHQRLGDLPRAVGYYRAARQVRPRDPHLVHNLARARTDLDGVPEPVEPSAAWMAFVTVGELGLVGLLVLFVAGAGLIRRRLQPGPAGSRWPWLLVALLGLLMAGSGWWAGRDLQRRPVVVVVDTTAVARDVARADGEQRFALPPGSEVRVLRSLGEFLLIETSRDDRGWVPRSAVFHVGPGDLR